MSTTTATPTATPRFDTTPTPNAPTTMPSSGTSYTLPGVSWLSLDVDGSEGTLTVGDVSVGLTVQPSTDGSPTRVDADLSGVTLGALSSSAVAAGATDPLAALPPTLSQVLSSVAIKSVAVSLDLATHRLVGVDLEVDAVPSWPLVPDHIVLDELSLTLSIIRADPTTTVEVSATATLSGVPVVLTVSHDAAGSFGVSLATEGDQRLGMATIASFVGDDLPSHLPSQLSALSEAGLTDAKVVFVAGGIDAVEVNLAAGSPIVLPDPASITVDGVTVHVAVEHPTDAVNRTVAVSIGGTVTFAGAAFVVRIERDPAATGAWSLHAGLAEGAALTASAVATAYGASVPSDLPELALNGCALDVTLDGSSVSFAAGSSTDWTVPVGPDGLGIGRLAVAFARTVAAEPGSASAVSGSVSGVVHLAGVDVPVTYAVPGGLVLQATIDQVAPFALLQDVVGAAAIGALTLPPELVALALTDVVLSIDVEKAELSFAASGPGFNRVQAVVRKDTSWGFAVGIELADDYRFSSLSSDLAGLDSVHLPDALIVISSFDDTTFTFDELQPDAGTGVSKGVVIDGRLDLSGLGADTFLGEAHLDVVARMGPSLADLELDAGVGDIAITDGVVLKNAEFSLHPDPENVSISVSGAVDVTIDSSLLQFVGGVTVVPNGISFFATMKGTWQDPFGAKGIALSNVSLQIGSDFEGVPSIGIAGGLTVGAFQGSAAISFNSQLPSQSVLIVAFNHLSLMDVVDTFCPPGVTAGIPADVSGTLAGISLEDVDLYVVPQDTMIGALSYQQGLRVGGKLHVAGFTAQADVEIDQANGVKASGSLSPVVIGDIFSLTSAGTDPTAGPDLDIEVTTTSAPKVEFSGKVNLLGVSAAAAVSFSDAGFDFGCSGRVFELFEADLSAKGGNLSSGAGFMVRADLHQDFLSDLARRAAAVLQQAGADAQAQIASAQHGVDSAQVDVTKFAASVDGAKADLAQRQADADAQIQAATSRVTQAGQALSAIDAQINATRGQIQAERDAAAAQLRDLQQKLAAAQAPVSSLNSQISSQQSQIDQLNSDIAWWHSWYNNLAWYDKAWGWTQLGAEVGWRGTQVAALTVSIAALRASIATANGILQGAQQAVNAAQAAQVTYPVDQDPRILAQQGGRGAAALGLQIAQGALDAARQATAVGISAANATLVGFQQQLGSATAALQVANAGLAQLNQGIGEVAGVGVYIAEHGLGALLDVKTASFAGSIDTTSGGSVTLDAEVVFQGTGTSVHLAYDFHDLVAGATALAKEVLPSLPG